MRRFLHALALIGALAILTTACASDKDTGLPAGPTEAPSSEVCDGTIDMTVDLKFAPVTCTVKVGTTVTWTTVAGSAAHTATSEPNAPVKFDSGEVPSGDDFSFKFDQAGEIPYYCKFHAAPGARVAASMIGTIVVEAA